MRLPATLALTAAVFLAYPTVVLSASEVVSAEQEAAWLRWLIPLPKAVAIKHKIVVPAATVGIRLRDDAQAPERAAAAELRSLFQDRAGAEAKGSGVQIRLGVVDAGGKLDGAPVPDTERLKTLPNREQAYLIRPLGDDRLLLAALDPRGVYHAAQTLRQLLEGQFADGKVAVPLAAVTDWPDLAERGQWGGSANRDIVRLARHKMNLVESHVKLGITADGRGEARADPELLALVRRHALKLVPIITHLDQLRRTGLFDRFPGCRGKGEGAGDWGGRTLAACFAEPKTGQVVADWMADLADQPGVTDINVWLSESHVQCGCPVCRKAGQFVLETRAAVQAWRRARETHPNLGLRILLTQGSCESNEQVLAEAPPEVGITYYHGGKTYDSSREPMIYPLLERFAAKGRWLGVYPQLTASWRIVCPWSGPQFIRYRMNEFVEEKLACVCGYATPDNRLYDFNVTAAAEWSWNAKGRTAEEFAAAWATRRGLENPDAIARWAVTLGEVAWDVYGSGIPYPQFFGRAARMVERRQKPVLGEGMFRYFPTAEHLAQREKEASQSVALAERHGSPALVAESRVIQGYVGMVSAIHALADAVAGKKKLPLDERRDVQTPMAALCRAGVQTADALRDWERAIDPGCGGRRFQDTVNVTEKTVVEIGDALEPLGIRNPLKPYLRKEIGAWESDDFKEREAITKTFDVTEHVTVPGKYQVGFRYTRGWHGLHIRRVALASAPKGQSNQRTVLSEDEHNGTAANRNRANVYTVTLNEHDPDRRYFIIADIRGTTSEGKPANRQGCNGSVWMKAQRPDDWLKRLDGVKPLTDDELKARRATGA
jgi:hypothetical protein